MGFKYIAKRVPEIFSSCHFEQSLPIEPLICPVMQATQTINKHPVPEFQHRVFVFVDKIAIAGAIIGESS